MKGLSSNKMINFYLIILSKGLKYRMFGREER